MNDATPPLELSWLLSTLVDCLSSHSGFLPPDRHKALVLTQRFSAKELGKYTLLSDLFWVLRQAITLDSDKSQARVRVAAPLFRFLADSFASLRPGYKQFVGIPEEKGASVINYWQKDSEAFGGADESTRFLAQDLCAHFALELNYPELFIGYKNLVLRLFKSISETGGVGELEQSKLDEMENRLNRVWIHPYYKQLAKDFTALDRTGTKEIKTLLKILRIVTFPVGINKITTLFESRTSILEVLPYSSNGILPKANQPFAISPWSVNMDVPVVFDEIEFQHVVPESRRQSGCDSCRATGILQCPQCHGEKKVPCGACKEGITTCLICNGSGEEPYVEYEPRIITCACNGKGCPDCNGVGFHREKIAKESVRPCQICSARGKVSCIRCSGKLLVPCPSCISKGQVECGKCKGMKSLEHRQVVTVNLTVNTKVYCPKNPSVPDKLVGFATTDHFTSFAICQGKDLGQRSLKELYKRDIPLEFFTLDIQNLKAETQVPSKDFKLKTQEFRSQVTQFYLVEYKYKGQVSKAWWHPKSNKFLGTEIMLMAITDHIKCAVAEWKAWRFSSAVEILFYAELLAAQNGCESQFQKKCKVCPTMLRFGKWIKKQFTVQE